MPTYAPSKQTINDLASTLAGEYSGFPAVLSDANDVAFVPGLVPCGLYLAATGNVAVTYASGATAIITCTVAGQYVMGSITRVKSTSTTIAAANIAVLYYPV
ncbi:hypothetical protein BH10PSE17_BH10PSE17_25130 [soil metagenome]